MASNGLSITHTLSLFRVSFFSPVIPSMCMFPFVFQLNQRPLVDRPSIQFVIDSRKVVRPFLTIPSFSYRLHLTAWFSACFILPFARMNKSFQVSLDSALNLAPVPVRTTVITMVSPSIALSIYSILQATVLSPHPLTSLVERMVINLVEQQETMVNSELNQFDLSESRERPNIDNLLIPIRSFALLYSRHIIN